MAKFNIKADSVQLIGDKKVGLEVKFKTEAGVETNYFYHEVETTDKELIEKELQASADAYEATVLRGEVEAPELTTGQYITNK